MVGEYGLGPRIWFDAIVPASDNYLAFVLVLEYSNLYTFFFLPTVGTMMDSNVIHYLAGNNIHDVNLNPTESKLYTFRETCFSGINALRWGFLEQDQTTLIRYLICCTLLAK